MERHELNGCCIEAVKLEDVHNYHQFLETNAGEELVVNCLKHNAFALLDEYERKKWTKHRYKRKN